MNRWIMLGALCIVTLPGIACDVCGLYLGLQPHDRTSSFGLWYRMRYLHGDVTSNSVIGLAKHGGHATGTVVGSPTTAEYKELYAVLEARGQWWFGQRFNVMAGVPLVNNYQAVNGVQAVDLYAVGDPLLMARYVAVNTRCSGDSALLRHRLTFGLGAKLPLGQHDLVRNGEVVDHDLQPGTGTTDILSSVEYLLRKAQWGLGTSFIGRFNGTDAEGWAMGNGLSSTTEVFRVFDRGSVQWMPSIGAYHELAFQDRQHDVLVEGSGTSVLFSHLSARLWWRSFGATVVWQHALAQENGALMVPNRERLIVGLTYNINATH